MNSAEIRKVKAKIIATDKLMKCYDKKKQEIDVLNKNIVKLHRDYSKEMEDVALKLKSAIDEIDKLHDDKNLINYHYLNSQKIITDLKLEIEYLKKHNHELLSSINVKKGSITAEQCTTNSSTCPNYILYQNALGEIKSLKEDSKKRDLKEDPEFEKYLQDIEDGAITDTDSDSDMDKKNVRKEAQEIIKISPEKELQIEVLNNEFQEPEPKKQRKSISTTISPKNKIDNELLIPKTHNYEKLKKTLNHFNLSYKDL